MVPVRAAVNVSLPATIKAIEFVIISASEMPVSGDEVLCCMIYDMISALSVFRRSRDLTFVSEVDKTKFSPASADLGVMYETSLSRKG